MPAATFAPAAAVLLIAGLATRFPWRRLPARHALWLTTGIASTAAAATVVTVAFVAGGFALSLPPGRWLGHVCVVFADHHAVPAPVGVAAVAFAVAVAVRVHGVLARRSRITRPDGPFTVVTAEQPVAYAIGSWSRGGVVVSTGMLDALDRSERRVLFAHERAHLDQHHERFLVASAVATAVIPVLRRLGDDVRLAVERCADDAAVRAVGGDRALVARSIARAALAVDAHAPAMAFTGSTVGHRVRCLLDGRQRPPLLLRGIGLAGLVGTFGGVLVLAHHLGELVVHLCS